MYMQFIRLLNFRKQNSLHYSVGGNSMKNLLGKSIDDEMTPAVKDILESLSLTQNEKSDALAKVCEEVHRCNSSAAVDNLSIDQFVDIVENVVVMKSTSHG
jgi:hypothetical protein